MLCLARVIGFPNASGWHGMETLGWLILARIGRVIENLLNVLFH